MIKNIVITPRFRMNNHAVNGSINPNGNTTSIKRLSDGRAYFSGQMAKHVLFSSIAELNEIDPASSDTYVSTGDAVNPNITQDLRADMGGFLRPVDGMGSITRKAPIDATLFVAEKPSKVSTDLLVRLKTRIDRTKSVKGDEDKANENEQALANSNFSESDLFTGSFSVDLGKLSYLKIPKYVKDEDFMVNYTVYAAADDAERVRRARLLIQSTGNLTAFAKQGRFATASEPEQIFISLDTRYTRYSALFFDMSMEEQAKLVQDIESRGGKVFVGRTPSETRQAISDASSFINTENIYKVEGAEICEDPYGIVIRDITKAKNTKAEKAAKKKSKNEAAAQQKNEAV